MTQAPEARLSVKDHLAGGDKRKAWRGATMVAAMLGDADSKARRKRELQTKFEEFCTDSSLSAITRAYTAKNKMKRYVWVILFIGAMTIISVQTYFVVTKFFSYPSETTIEMTFTPDLEFPAVTICNLNPIRMSAISDPNSPFFEFRAAPNPMKDPLFSKMALMNSVTTISAVTEASVGGGNETTMGVGFSTTPFSGGGGVTTMSGGGGGSTTTSAGAGGTTTSSAGGAPPPKSGRRRKRDTSGDFNRWNMLHDKSTAKKFYGQKNERFEKEQMFAEKVASFGLEELGALGHQIDNFISDCSMAGYPCSPSNFTTIQNYKYGNCFTFNSGMDGVIQKSNWAGSLYGLTLELFIEQDEYVPQFSQEAGVRVVIHKPRTMPFPEDEGFNVPPGASTALGLKKVAITRLPYPHGKCVKAPNTPTLYSKKYSRDYSKIACVKSCFQESVISSCGCAMAEYPIPDNTTLCDEENDVQENCKRNVTENFKKKQLGCDDKCLLPCDDAEYEVMVSQSVWPSKVYEGQFKQKLELGSSKMKKHSGHDSSRSQMVKVEVYFREMTFQNITQQESYSVANVLSDIGGTFGLWLGLSVISVCEFLEFVIGICTFKRRKREEQEKFKTPVSEISILQDLEALKKS